MPAHADLDNHPEFLEWLHKSSEAWNNQTP